MLAETDEDGSGEIDFAGASRCSKLCPMCARRGRGTGSADPARAWGCCATLHLLLSCTRAEFAHMLYILHKKMLEDPIEERDGRQCVPWQCSRRRCYPCAVLT